MYATDVVHRLLTHSQMLYPTVDMKNVDLLLKNTSDRLIQSLISKMEASQEDVQAIEQVRQSKACLEVPWHVVLRSFQSAVFMAAYKHYMDWHRSGKHKMPSADHSSHKKLKNPSEIPQSSFQQALQPSVDKRSG